MAAIDPDAIGIHLRDEAILRWSMLCAMKAAHTRTPDMVILSAPMMKQRVKNDLDEIL